MTLAPHSRATEKTPLRGQVVTVSDRVSAGTAEDRSGPLAVTLLADFGTYAAHPTVVPDERTAIAHALHAAVADDVDVVILTGGTGIGPRDVTPETIRPMLDKELLGVPEAIRANSRHHVTTSDLSRAIAGTIRQTFVVALPGSTGGVRDGMAVVGPLLEHAVHVLRGGDHPPHPHRTKASKIKADDSTPTEVALCQVTENELDTAEHAKAVSRSGAGAVVTFVGVVRDRDAGRDVIELEYEAHPSAQDVLADVSARVARDCGEVTIAVSHRTGHLQIGDAALVIAVSAAHREPALATCARLVDEVKERLPVWKHQTFADGTDEWVNCA